MLALCLRRAEESRWPPTGRDLLYDKRWQSTCLIAASAHRHDSELATRGMTGHWITTFWRRRNSIDGLLTKVQEVVLAAVGAGYSAHRAAVMARFCHSATAGPSGSHFLAKVSSQWHRRTIAAWRSPHGGSYP